MSLFTSLLGEQCRISGPFFIHTPLVLEWYSTIVIVNTLSHTLSSIQLSICFTYWRSNLRNKVKNKARTSKKDVTKGLWVVDFSRMLTTRHLSFWNIKITLFTTWCVMWFNSKTLVYTESILSRHSLCSPSLKPRVAVQSQHVSLHFLTVLINVLLQLIIPKIIILPV